MSTLPLTPDELLTTTRAVRKRLDFGRPVDRQLIEECIAIAQQAPTGSNAQNWHFVVVTDSRARTAIAEFYRRGRETYYRGSAGIKRPAFQDPARQAAQKRISGSSAYLAEHLQDVPVLVIPCVAARVEGLPLFAQASIWGSILPAAWSFMLAARARGLGTAWTTFHLQFEREVASLLGIPYETVTQTALIPVAHTLGTEFKAATREPLDQIVHWDRW